MKPLVVQEAVEAMQGRVLGRMANFSIVGVSTDSREVGPGQMFVALRGERYDGHAFVEEALSKGACAAVVSRVADLPEAVRQAGVLIVVDDTRQGLLRLGAYYRRQLAAQVIAVTGSNGKTTTKQMIHAVLSGERKGRCSPKSFNNEIGVPLTLLSAEGSDEYLVVELGSNCPGEIDRLARLVRPDMAVITGVAAAHLEGLGDIEGVAEEKMAVLGHVREGGFAAVNVDHAAVRRRLGWRAQGCTVVGFGLDERAELRAT
ncbi:MAG: UDP-N-acetylmuramoyl-tripeptide--D-alanyl-D-alanine ligase, partial [Phycisphaerae bacterium]